MAYFYEARIEIPIGAALTPDGGQASREYEVLAVEQVLDHFRPAGCLPRADTVFLSGTDSPGGDGEAADYIYLVETADPPEYNDRCWWDAIYASDDLLAYAAGDRSALERLRPLARGYWSGEPMGSVPSWETRVRSARVVDQISGYAMRSGLPAL